MPLNGSLPAAPYDLLFDGDIGRIGRYRLLIIAGQECLSDKTVSTIREFILGGGKVFVTGDSGACDQYGLARENNPLVDMADGRSVIFNKNAGMAEAMKEASKWIYTSAVALPKDANAVLRAVRKMLDNRDIPFSVSAPQGVFANWTKLPDGRNVLHLVNYANEKKPVKVLVRFASSKLSGRKYALYQPENDSKLAGRLNGKYSTLKIQSLNTYALIEIGN